MGGALDLLEDVLEEVSPEEWRMPMEMVRRNVRRIADIQAEVADIMKDRDDGIQPGLKAFFDQFADHLALIAARAAGRPRMMERVRARLHRELGLDTPGPATIRIAPFLRHRIEALSPLFSHREVRIRLVEDADGVICMPEEHFTKIIDGLVRNGVENTPDGGDIVISISEKGAGVLLCVHDFGGGHSGGVSGSHF